MPFVHSTATRVSAHTADELNAQFRRDLEARIAHFAAHPDGIDARLAELDREWDIERALETTSASVSLFGLALGFTRHKAWFALPLVVQGFFLQHALQGWCPPLPVFRRLGFRTQQQIEAERHALKALRGDFDTVHEHRDHPGRATHLVNAVDA